MRPNEQHTVRTRHLLESISELAWCWSLFTLWGSRCLDLCRKSCRYKPCDMYLYIYEYMYAYMCMHTCALYRHRGRTLASLVFVRTHRLAQSENPDIVSARRARPGPSPHIPTLGALSTLTFLPLEPFPPRGGPVPDPVLKTGGAGRCAISRGRFSWGARTRCRSRLTCSGEPPYPPQPQPSGDTTSCVKSLWDTTPCRMTGVT